MKLRARADKGQTILPEYVVTFFLVIGVVVAMTLYVQRGLQGRMRDARNFVVTTASSACDANCLRATDGKILYEYEPYYANVQSETYRAQEDRSSLAVGGSSGVFRKKIDQESVFNSISIQKPPKDAQ